MNIEDYNFGEVLLNNFGNIRIKDENTFDINLNGIDYYLNNFAHGGGNSRLFTLAPIQALDEIPTKTLKICKFPYPRRENLLSQPKYKIHRRFLREIESLLKCKANDLNDVITIHEFGKIFIHRNERAFDPYLFYTMDYANSDLRNFLAKNQLNELDKLDLCIQLCSALYKLHSLNIYHRDIKPDNILLVDDIWQIADLGLVGFRNEDILLDKPGEFIGPRGWMNPEAMNKALSETVKHYDFDCNIDEKSDIFQMGKLLWFILQGNAPIGCIKERDFACSIKELYPILHSMLNHTKAKRPLTIDDVTKNLIKVYGKYIKVAV